MPYTYGISDSCSMDEVPFVDLYPQYEELKLELDGAVSAIVRESAFIPGKSLSEVVFIEGKPVSEFESELAASVGVKHAVGVATCTSAGWMLLQAMGIGAGDE